MHLLHESVEGMDYLVLRRPHAKCTVIMMHGYGASMNDLVDLHGFLDPTQLCTWVFPNGIMDVALGGHVAGKAWFPISSRQLELAAVSGRTIDFSEMEPEGLFLARQRMIGLSAHLNVKSEDLVLGGFSQGAMLACEMGFNLKEKLRGFLLFSGTLVNAASWKLLARSQSNVPFFQSHGRSDAILDIRGAEKLNQLMKDSELRGDLFKFDGFHEIPESALSRAQNFLGNLVR